MPQNIQIIAAKEYVRSDISGKVDLQTSITILKELAEAHARTANSDILLDTRAADGTAMSGLDIYELVICLRDLGLGRANKIAVLYTVTDGLDRGKMFEMLAQDRGLQVSAFQDFESAYNWLTHRARDDS